MHEIGHESTESESVTAGAAEIMSDCAVDGEGRPAVAASRVCLLGKNRLTYTLGALYRLKKGNGYPPGSVIEKLKALGLFHARSRRKPRDATSKTISTVVTARRRRRRSPSPSASHLMELPKLPCLFSALYVTEESCPYHDLSCPRSSSPASPFSRAGAEASGWLWAACWTGAAITGRPSTVPATTQ